MQRDRHRAWLTGLQNPDGGFSGREGESDLYYTGFALRSLAILQGLEPDLCVRCAGFLSTRLSAPASVIDLFSLLVSRFLVILGGGPDVFESSGPDWPVRVTELLESFRTPDGGYGRSAESRYGSTYVSFLNLLAMELLERPPLRLDELHLFVESRRREDGGYVEIAPMKRSATNPTAAAVGIFRMTGRLTPEVISSVVDFLEELPSDEGGYRAHDRIPFADLLSTFTAAWTLDDLGAGDRLDPARLRRFALSLEQKTGGFHAGTLDEVADVEYTFYGLGLLSLLTHYTRN